MLDEHPREDELEIQIIGLQGKIESLQKELKENKEEFVSVKKKDIERWIYLLKHDFTRYYIETEIKKYMGGES